MIESEREKLLPVHVIRAGFKERQFHITRNDEFAAYQISVCTGGSGKFLCGGKEHEILEGDVFMFSPRMPHEYYPTSNKWQMYFVVFGGEGADNVAEFLRFEKSEVRTCPDLSVKIKTKDICESILKSDDAYERSLLLYKLLGNVPLFSKKQYGAESMERQKIDIKIRPVVAFIEKNYKSPVSLDEMAELIDVSKSYLCRVFKQAYGITPVTFLLNFRISKAKQLLISTDMKIRLLAAECGFNDTSYFCMMFKKSEGMTPEEFRTLHKD